MEIKLIFKKTVVFIKKNLCSTLVRIIAVEMILDNHRWIHWFSSSLRTGYMLWNPYRLRFIETNFQITLFIKLYQMQLSSGYFRKFKSFRFSTPNLRGAACLNLNQFVNPKFGIQTVYFVCICQTLKGNRPQMFFVLISLLFLRWNETIFVPRRSRVWI